MGSLIPKKKKASYDIGAADYRQAVKDRTDSQRTAANELLKQLEDQRKADAPSLAAAQLKSAAGKNLSQLLAATAARRGSSPLSQVVGLGVGAQGARDLSGAAAQAGLQESTQREQLAAKLGIGQQQQDVAQIMEPGKLLADAEKRRFEADAERNRQLGQARSMMNSALLTGGANIAMSQTGGMFGGGGGGGTGNPSGQTGGVMQSFGGNGPSSGTWSNMPSSDFGFSDERGKKNIKPAKKPVNDFLEALLDRHEPKQAEEVPELSEDEVMRQARQAAVMKLLGKGK